MTRSSAGNGQSYRFYGLVPGGGTGGGNDYTFTVPFVSGVYFAGTGVLNTHNIVNMNIEIDPGISRTSSQKLRGDPEDGVLVKGYSP